MQQQMFRQNKIHYFDSFSTLSFTTGVLLVLLITALVAPAAVADDLFSWKDENGSIHYSARPPAGAREIKPVGNRTFSTYSSKRVFSGYGIPYREPSSKPETNDVVEVPPESFNPVSIQQDLKQGGADDDLTEATTIAKSEIPNSGEPELAVVDVVPDSIDPPITDDKQTPADLIQGSIQIKHDSENNIVACKVSVRNAGAMAVHKLVVSFEFEDGSLVPAVGPESLPGNEEAFYEIADELLPVVIGTAPNNSRKPLPKVVIEHG